MKNFFFYFSFFVLLASTTSCVTRARYQELLDQQESQARRYATADTLQSTRQALEQQVMELNAYYKAALLQVEELRGTNKGLYANLQELQEKYDNIIKQRTDFMSTSSYEKMNLTEQLTAYQQELDEKEKYLRNLEWELAQKEERLNQMEDMGARGPGSQQPAVSASNAETQQKLQQLRALVLQKNQLLQQLSASVNQYINNLPPSDFSQVQRDGKLYLILGQNLLFPEGANVIDGRGQQVLQQLAALLRANPELQIKVVGHTDTDGTPWQNWDLSVMRATAVVKELVSAGLSPTQVEACGRSFYQAVAPSTNEAGRMANRRTEIIISPNLDELVESLMSAAQ